MQDQTYNLDNPYVNATQQFADFCKENEIDIAAIFKPTSQRTEEERSYVEKLMESRQNTATVSAEDGGNGDGQEDPKPSIDGILRSLQEAAQAASYLKGLYSIDIAQKRTLDELGIDSDRGISSEGIDFAFRSKSLQEILDPTKTKTATEQQFVDAWNKFLSPTQRQDISTKAQTVGDAIPLINKAVEQSLQQSQEIIREQKRSKEKSQDKEQAQELAVQKASDQKKWRAPAGDEFNLHEMIMFAAREILQDSGINNIRKVEAKTEKAPKQQLQQPILQRSRTI